MKDVYHTVNNALNENLSPFSSFVVYIDRSLSVLFFLFLGIHINDDEVNSLILKTVL